MGHDERERRGLALQASILNPFTDHLLRQAGISAGMRVLDIGCGVGDISLLAISFEQTGVTQHRKDTVRLRIRSRTRRIQRRIQHGAGVRLGSGS